VQYPGRLAHQSFDGKLTFTRVQRYVIPAAVWIKVENFILRMPRRNRAMSRQKTVKPFRPATTEKSNPAKVARSATSTGVPGMSIRLPAVIPEIERY